MVLQKMLSLGISLLLSIISIVMVSGHGRNTVDDTKYIQDYFNANSQTRVLGASTNKKDNCPEKSPIIGWIDFRGKKLIKNELPQIHQPSSCFASIQEANEAGFFSE